MRAKFIYQCYLNIETEGNINLLLTFIQWFVTQSNLSLIFTKTLLFPHKTVYFSNGSHGSYKNEPCEPF